MGNCLAGTTKTYSEDYVTNYRQNCKSTYVSTYIEPRKIPLQVQTCLQSCLGKHRIYEDGIIQLRCLHRIKSETLLLGTAGVIWIKSSRGGERYHEYAYVMSKDRDVPVYEVICIRRKTQKKKSKETPGYFKLLLEQYPNILLIIADVAEEFIYSHDKGYRKFESFPSVI